jgi:hypothetical protein
LLIMLFDSDATIRSSFGFVFFGICTIIIFYFLYLKNKSDSSS